MESSRLEPRGGNQTDADAQGSGIPSSLALTASAVAPSTAHPPRRSGSVRSLVVRTVVLVAFVGLTGWNVTRSEALAEARTAYDRHDTLRALRGSVDHLDRRPWSHDAAILAARSASDQGFPELAEPYYQRAIRTGSLSLDDLQTRALGLMRRVGQRGQAIAVYEEILKRWPNDLSSLRRLATAYYSNRKLSRAHDVAERLSHLPEGAVAGYTLLGTIYSDDKSPAQAAAAYEKVLELDPYLRSMPMDRSLFWDELVANLIIMGRSDDARRVLVEALTRSDDAVLHYQLGEVEQTLGSLDEARACWERAIERDKSFFKAWRSLGKLELQKQHPDRALPLLTRALELAPNDFETAYSLSLTLQQLGRVAEAERFKQKADRLRPGLKPTRGGM